MNYIPPIFSLIVGVAGWFYVLHAHRAGLLADIEGSRTNLLRIRLRRIGGFCMLLLGLLFYLGVSMIDSHTHALLSMISLALVIILMMIVLFLGYIDLRLTRKMKEEFLKRNRIQ